MTIDGRRYPVRFTEYVHSRVMKSNRDTFSFDKLEMKDVANACKVPCPQVYAEVDDPHSIQELPRVKLPLVIKPRDLAGAKGVLFLSAEKHGRYFEEFSQEWLTLEEIKEKISQVIAAKRPTAKRCIVEQGIKGENAGIPFDYKLYTFQGCVEFVLQIDRNGSKPRLSFFGSNFTSLPEGLVYSHSNKSVFVSPTLPKNYKQMIDVAERVATHLGTAFCSVDLYTDGKRVMLGEITAGPGGPYVGRLFAFSPQYDIHLGAKWLDAISHLGLERPVITGLPPVVVREQQNLLRKARCWSLDTAEKPSGLGGVHDDGLSNGD
ncbi:ATP-grasp fold amidoligase family protein [Gammaproteobacteria bacterium AB-CW1]|uniref:ATP-grasp fold amidoligase family protein n=1 Tax=Natronospira elongata TaxID=3110268 RepID=A0AAP6JGM2_9GAMM|nr:ATP-grasp fold amidoligase family protein [Gammaproteobacteria bacterium AB-CW1]